MERRKKNCMNVTYTCNLQSVEQASKHLTKCDQLRMKFIPPFLLGKESALRRARDKVRCNGDGVEFEKKLRWCGFPGLSRYKTFVWLNNLLVLEGFNSNQLFF